ncbi:MAG: hypothetical protein EA397_02825 [Deltaproteobacteria bacterium]|nr:MAG: hypothetical protein EA397_02825 [Deltaproteobacteria bacterium]
MWRLLPIVSVLSCAQRFELPEGELAASGTRAEIARVTFNRWTDFITLQLGLDEGCDVLFPVEQDDSTAWPPLQVTWVIYDDPRHVEDGDVVRDTFFSGDVLSASDFEPIEGLEPLGFKFLPPGQRAFLDLQHIEVFSGTELALDALFGRPMRARIFVETYQNEDETCEVVTTWCSSEQEPCVPEPLRRVHVELGTLNSVREVTFYP